MNKPRLNIGDQSWRQAREALITRCEKCGGTDFDEEQELGGEILTCKDCGRIIVNQVMLSADHNPCPLNEAIAFNEGTRDGYTGKPRRALLQSEFRQHYILGYRSGSWPRFTSREIRKRSTNEYIWWYSAEEYQAISDELYDLMFMPRYPHDPPVWYA